MHPEDIAPSRSQGNFGPITDTRRLRIKIGHLKRSLRYLDERYARRRGQILLDMHDAQRELDTALAKGDS